LSHPVSRSPSAVARAKPGQNRVAAAVSSLVGCAALALTAITLSPAQVSASALNGSAASGSLISAARCAANKAAGTITFLTSFDYYASVGILDPVAAQARGYFKDLCLSVKVIPTAVTDTASIVASGRAKLGGVGGATDVLTAQSNGIDVWAVATYGNVPISTLLTMPDITNLKQLEGKRLGFKGAMPPDISAMLRIAGVDESKIKEVSVGYDPTILPRGQVQALTAYKSSEPVELKSDGYKIRQWNPDSYGIKGTFNTQIVNPAFAKAHPTAVEDFLRASLHAYDYCVTNATQCVEYAAKLAGKGYSIPQDVSRWKIETGLVAKSELAGKGVGAQSTAQFTPEEQLLVKYKLIKKTPPLASFVKTQYISAIYRGSELIWPAP
jgi:ABC-type nitrate/sulfonate/bicarbonate transport system substrate-binding protein